MIKFFLYSELKEIEKYIKNTYWKRKSFVSNKYKEEACRFTMGKYFSEEKMSGLVRKNDYWDFILLKVLENCSAIENLMQS